MPRVTVPQIAAFYRFMLGDTLASGGEGRIRCPVAACEGRNDERSVSINLDDPFGPWKCFRGAYGCGASGNKLMLMYAMKHGEMPPGGKLTGAKFREIALDLAAIDGCEASQEMASETRRERSVAAVDNPRTNSEAPLKLKPNVPLAESDNERARELVTLDEHLVMDLENLSPDASKYMRSRSYLSPEACRKFRMGYMPGNTKSTLRGTWVFCIADDAGNPLAWVGRDVRYEAKLDAYNAGGRQGAEPSKYRFPKQELFRRGLELYGQDRIGKNEFSEGLASIGLVVTEGFHATNRLQLLGVPAVGIMSNRATEQQIAKIAQISREVAAGKVTLFFDADAKGDEGCKEALWGLMQQRLDVRLACTRVMHEGRFVGRQPDSLSQEEWLEIEATLVRE
ncbi:MAG: hypothetical protein KDA42_18505 [Planctomycetales bacterium]|nr:hypothetical protein [Planctomycetales bacterium]